LASWTDFSTPRERTLGTDWIGGQVGLRAGLDVVNRKIPSLPLLETECPAHGLVSILTEIPWLSVHV